MLLNHISFILRNVQIRIGEMMKKDHLLLQEIDRIVLIVLIQLIQQVVEIQIIVDHPLLLLLKKNWKLN